MPTNETDLRASDRTAVLETVKLVSGVTEADLFRPTPCAGWDLAALLDHMTDQHHEFAAAARGSSSRVAVAEPSAEPQAGDLARRYTEAADEVLAAFAAVESLDRPFWLAEFNRAVPGRVAVGFHLVDYVVHGWDVARTLGVPFEPDAEILARTLPIARAVPDGPERLEANAAFAPALPVTPGADPMGEILQLLGRDPAHPGPALSGRGPANPGPAPDRGLAHPGPALADRGPANPGPALP